MSDKTLNYSPKRRPRRNRLFIAGALLLAAIIVWVRYGGQVLDKSYLLLVQHRCSADPAREDTPVYVEYRPEEIAPILIKYPALVRLSNLTNRGCAGRESIDWRWFRGKIAPEARFTPEATIFVGQLRNADGAPVLVGVSISHTYTYLPGLFYNNSPTSPLAFEIIVISPAGIFTNPKVNRASYISILHRRNLSALRPVFGGALNIFPGRVQASDPSKFAAPLILDDRKGQLVGTLRLDGVVTLTLEGFNDAR